MRFATALSVHSVTLIVESASWVAIASFASILIIGESVELGSAPVAISSFDVSLAGAFARYFVTTAVVNSAECVAPAGIASFGVVDFPVPEAGLASVASISSDVSLADASAGDEVVDRIRLRLAFAVVLTADSIAITRLTNSRVAN